VVGWVLVRAFGEGSRRTSREVEGVCTGETHRSVDEPSSLWVPPMTAADCVSGEDADGAEPASDSETMVDGALTTWRNVAVVGDLQ